MLCLHWWILTELKSGCKFVFGFNMKSTQIRFVIVYHSLKKVRIAFDINLEKDWILIDKGPSMSKYCILLCRHIVYPMADLKCFGKTRLVEDLNIVWRHLENRSWKNLYIWKKCRKGVCLNIKQLQWHNQYIHDTMICYHYPC